MDVSRFEALFVSPSLYDNFLKLVTFLVVLISFILLTCLIKPFDQVKIN